MARNITKDYEELPKFAEKWKGKLTADCIEAYAKKRKIVQHRVASVFWDLVDSGKIKVYKETPIGILFFIE